MCHDVGTSLASTLREGGRDSNHSSKSIETACSKDPTASTEAGHIGSITLLSDVDSKVSRRELGSLPSAKETMSSLFGVELDEELAEVIRQNVTFEGAPYLMRAVRLNRVMGGMARIFRDSKGSAATYELSERATSLRYFLSHNWCISRWDKFLALSLKFNGDLALTFLLFFCMLCGLLGHSDLLPTIEDYRFEARVGYICRTFCCPLTLLVMFFGNSIASRFGWRGPLVFLDKVCIHQTDTCLQREGIARLGAFLRMSQHMLVLYSDVYLRKLWTTLEVANFLALHSVEDIEVVPVMQPRLVLAAFPLCYFSVLMVMICVALDMSSNVQYPFLLIAGCVSLVMLRRWARHKKDMEEELKTFEVRKCTCAVEADRPVVYAKIADLMRARGLIGRHASVEEGLEAFDTSVRQNLPQAFSTIFRGGSLSYKNYLIVSCLLVLPSSMDRVVLINHGVTPHEVAAALVRDVLWIFTCWPLALFLLEVMASKQLHLRGWKQALWLLFSAVSVTHTFAWIHIGCGVVTERSASDITTLRIFTATATFLVLLTFFSAAASAGWTPCRAWKAVQRHRRHRQNLAKWRPRESEQSLQERPTPPGAARRVSVSFDLHASEFDETGLPSSWAEDDCVSTAAETVHV